MSTLEEHIAEQAQITLDWELSYHEAIEEQLGEALDILSELRDGPLSEDMKERIDRLLNGEH